MQGKQILKKVLFSGFSVSILGLSLLAVIQIAGAQTSQPEFLMTWQALNSYVPSFYQGAVLPNSQSKIVASLNVVLNGKPVNLSNQTIYWYLDDTFLGGGIGNQEIVFRPFGQAPATLTLRAELPDYPGGLLEHEIEIPLVGPQAVIEAPYPQGQVSQNSFTLQALPYFFNASSVTPLVFSWSVNGQNTSNVQNPESLQVNMPASTPSGFAIAVALTIQNSEDMTEAAQNLNLTYQSQL